MNVSRLWFGLLGCAALMIVVGYLVTTGRGRLGKVGFAYLVVGCTLIMVIAMSWDSSAHSFQFPIHPVQAAPPVQHK